MPEILRTEWALLPTGLARNIEIHRVGGLITHIGPATGPCAPGLVMPGLVNAHTHLELCGLQQPGGQGLPHWVRGLMGQRRSQSPAEQAAAIAQGIASLEASGTQSVGEVSNARCTDLALGQSSLSGAVYHELLGIDPQDCAEKMALVQGPAPAGFHLQAVPHAPYSCSPELLVAAITSRTGPALATLHLDEDPAERQFVLDGTGPWADVLDSLGRNRAAFEPPACTPVQYLERLGLLDKVALVHCTLTRDEDLDLLSKRGTPVVLCPSSNLHITGMLPDVLGMVARGIPLALGTDSTASGQSLDVMGEVRILAQHFPEVPLETWLLAATHGGGRVVGVVAELVLGATIGLIRVPDPAEPWASAVERQHSALGLPSPLG